MKIMMSACLVGKNVMYYGGNFLNGFLQKIIEHPEIEVVHFCPEDIVLGTPRNNMLIHNGDGNDVLNGTAKVIDTNSKDCTDVMLMGANKMLQFAVAEKPDLIILTEGSDSCGSNIILDPKTKKDNKYHFKRGMGLAAALLKRNGFKIMGHMSEKEIYDLLKSKLNGFPKIEKLKTLEEFEFYPKPAE